jgi:cysteine-rich repeat protein
VSDGVATTSGPVWSFTTGACGNGIVGAGEGCDDGNTLPNDGCSATCTVETCWACAGQPSSCAPANGAPCDDGLFCTLTDTCSGGACVGAGNPCAGGTECDDHCNEATDDCAEPSGTPCASDGNPCSIDRCDGAGACAHVAGNAGVVCRSGSGDVCDPDEVCNGTSITCPANVVQPASTVCRAAIGACDVAEHCPGVAGQPCPANAVASASVECRGVAGPCDVAEHCDGATTICPSDAFLSGDPCRPAAGDCDVAETCPGTGPACPPDAKRTGECRAAAGVCDVAESCDGIDDDCPADGFAPSSQECRASGGACDLAEHCTGVDATCPPDTGLPDTDGDGVCDALDDCPSVADPAQTNGDADPLGDACDPCTGGVPAAKQKLTLTKLLAPAGDDRLAFKGQAVLASPFDPPLDPLANGVRLLIEDATGAPVLDATVAGGAYDSVTREGWKVNGSATAWTYKSPGTQPQGITVVGVKTSSNSPGLVKLKAKGKDGSYAVAPANLPVRVTVVLDPPTAATGECVEATWTAPPPVVPSCSAVATGNVVKCK